MPEKRRLPAYKVRIAAIARGKYVHNEGLVPKYVLSRDGRRLTRVRILATVVNRFVSHDRKFYSATLDDGTETIKAKAFSSLILEPFAIGDIIDLIGRVRKYNEEIYIVPEAAWKADPNLELLRELEIRLAEKEWEQKRGLVASYAKQVSDINELKKLCSEIGVSPEDVEGVIEAQEAFAEEIAKSEADRTAVKQRILDLITRLDAGDGCDYGSLIESAGLEEGVLDGIVQELLDEGSCFEPRPGKIKKL